MTPDHRPIAEAAVRFSAEETAERERLAAPRDVFGRAIVELEIAPRSSVPRTAAPQLASCDGLADRHRNGNPT